MSPTGFFFRNLKMHTIKSSNLKLRIQCSMFMFYLQFRDTNIGAIGMWPNPSQAEPVCGNFVEVIKCYLW